MTEAQRRFPKLEPNLRRRIVEQAAKTVREKYIFEEDGRAMSDLLTRRLREGTFDEITELQRLTIAITATLHSIREDLHLAALTWVPPAEGAPSEGDDLGPLRARWKRTNHEFRRLEILLGNVGYVDLRGFVTATDGGPTAVAAMTFLANVDALIFDLRENGGGRDLVSFLMSYLFDRPRHVHTAHFRERDEQTWTCGYVPGPRFPEHPVFVLTSRATFSAAEDFAYNLQQLGRAVVVGERTKGGAHPVEFYRFPDLFLELVIPNAYSENPVSRSNWEESGVVPNIEVSAPEALLAAHEQALLALLAQEPSDEERAFRTWALESVRLRRAPYEPHPESLDAYTGDYTNAVRIERAGASLTFRWDGHTYRLAPLSEHCFEFDQGIQRATFTVEDGEATSFLWATQDGESWRIPRVRDQDASG